MNIQNLGGDLFTNFFIFSIVDTVTNNLLFLFGNRVDRKTLLRIGLSVQSLSIACLLFASFDADMVNLRIVSSSCLRAGLAVSFYVNYLYTAETFPTTMRQVCMGTCSIFSRIGSMMAPFVKELTILTHLSVPTGMFLAFTVTNLILIQFIPETGKIQMPDTIRQKEQHLESRRNSRSVSFSIQVVN
jgi:OCT family organic cation transporter-like MFS transporter 15